MATLCVFGDSTAYGAWDLEKGGWVNRLWLFLAKNKDDDLYNLSISGGTTETILARFENEAKVRQADAIIFQNHLERRRQQRFDPAAEQRHRVRAADLHDLHAPAEGVAGFADAINEPRDIQVMFGLRRHAPPPGIARSRPLPARPAR